jgi:DNA modification methylase
MRVEKIKTATLINANCFDYLPTIEDNSIDLIFTDPPYDNVKYMEELTDKQKEILANEFYRILKPNGNLALFCGYVDKWKWYNILTKRGFKFIRELIWCYPNPSGMRPAVSHGLRKFIASHETILWCVKNEEEYYFNNDGLIEKDYFEYPAYCGILRVNEYEYTTSEKLGTTPKPLAIARIIVNRLCVPNGTILDPFAGLGTFGIAAIEQEKNYIGIEIKEEIFNAAVERLKKFKNEKLRSWLNE